MGRRTESSEPVRYDIGNQSAHNINNAGRDINNWNDSSGAYMWATARGISRFFALIGALVFFAGFAALGYLFILNMMQPMDSTGPVLEHSVTLPDLGPISVSRTVTISLPLAGVLVGIGLFLLLLGTLTYRRD